MTNTDTLSTTTISHSDRAERLARASTEWSDRIAADPASARLTYRVNGRGEGSVATRIKSGKHEFLIDEPAALAGDDSAPSPVEFALGALISCQIVVYRLYADALGIQLDDITIDAEGDLDARRLFGLDDSVRAGFSAVRLHVKVTGSETQSRYDELHAIVEAHCPVLDLFANPTPVTATVLKQ